MSFTWKKGLATVASVGMITALLAGCGTSNSGGAPSNTTGGTPTSSTSGTPREGGSITLDMNTAVPDLDPAVAFDTTSAEIEQQIYQQLVTYDKGTNKIVPYLAKDYEVSQDGLTYTFHLKSGITFSNGDPLTSKDFVFELERILDKKMTPKPSPGAQFYMDIKGAQAYYDGKAKKISGVSTPDDSTIVFTLDKPEQFFLKILAMPFMSAVDPAFVNKVGNAAFDTTTAMGTGGFTLEKNSTTQVVLKKNPKYWEKDKNGNQLPYLDSVTINVTSNNDNLEAMHFEQGQTAFMTPWLQGGDGIPSGTFNTLMSNPKYKSLITKLPQNAIYYYGMNMKKTINGKANPLSNKTVRQAIEYGFNDKQILKLENGAVESSNQPLPSGLEGYVKNLDPSAQYSFDPSKAKQLLKQAGYANGLTIDLWNENTNQAKLEDQAFQQMMKNIGITVNLHEVTWKDFLTKAMSGTAQMYYSGWQQDFPDASDFLNTLLNSNQIPQNNMSCYSNPQVDKWLNEAQYATSAQTRDNLYAKVINQFMSDAVWIPVIQNIGYYSVQSWVHGFYSSAVTYDPMTYIWVDAGH